MLQFGGPNDPPAGISPSINATVEWAIDTYGEVGMVQFANDQTQGTLDILGNYGGAWSATGYSGGPANATPLSVTNEIQQVVLSDAVGGTWTLNLNGRTTIPLVYNATAGAVQTALQGLSNIGSGNVAVSGNGTGSDPYQITFCGCLAGCNVSQLTANEGVLVTGGVLMVQVGGPQQGWQIQYTIPPDDGRTMWSLTPPSGRTLQFGGPNDPPWGISPSINAIVEWAIDTYGEVGTVQFADDQTQGTLDIIGNYGGTWIATGFTGGPARAAQLSTNEIQEVVLSNATGGTWARSLDGNTTAALPCNATACQVQTALAALANIGSGNVSVSGSGTTADPFLVTFQGALVGSNVDPLTVDNIGLVGNHAPVLTGADPLATLEPNPSSNAGTLVSTLLAGQASDAQGDPLGIAVTAVNNGNSNGTWQYQLAGGTGWTGVGNVSNTAELLLPGNALVRFVPAADWKGTAGITFRAWDQTSGTAGSLVTVANTGGSTAYSATTATAGIAVGVRLVPITIATQQSAGQPQWQIRYTIPPNDGQTTWSLTEPSGRVLQFGGSNDRPGSISPSNNATVEWVIDNYGGVGTVQFANDQTQGTLDIIGNYGGAWMPRASPVGRPAPPSFRRPTRSNRSRLIIPEVAPGP